VDEEGRARLASLLGRPDEAANILGDLKPEQARDVLAQMDEADDVRPLLAHPDETAGGQMTTSFIALRRHTSAQQAIDFLRQVEPDEETPYYLYVLDRNQKLLGVVGMRELVIARPDSLIGDIMNQEVISVPAGTDQEEAARVMARYNLASMPVVDGDGRLIGVITYDDLVDVIEEEATEDIYRLSGTSTGSDLGTWSPVSLNVRRRLPWLVINLFTAFLAASVISVFENTIAQLATLAVFQSIVAGEGGNAGTQALALMVRGIALGEVELRDVWRAIRRELAVGLLNGLVIGILVALGAWAWRGIPVLGLVLGLAMVGNLLAAGIAGTLVPLTLKALKLDPALASAVIVTTVTDVIGFGLFLGLATASLPYLH
jgi:magnesium transporter